LENGKTMSMIETHDVTKSYRSGEGLMEILHGVSLTIPAGQCAFIVGPSGSGKSTLLHLMGAMDHPTSGRVTIDGLELTKLTEPELDTFRRDKIGIIFQAFNLVGNLTALENVLVPFLPRGITPELRERAKAMLTKVGLGHRLTHRPIQMSGGEQQRVAIARALVKNPQVVLADEPTGQLDSRTGEEVFRILRELQSELGTTLVVVTHDRRFIQPNDLVLEIEDGLLKN
jgi:putative ABC transport system ATP-binding protein